jgi:molybdopterin molybdotransferase
MPAMSVPVAEALGLVLAEPLRAPIALPPFDNSAMDGYAVRSVDVAAAVKDNPVELPVAEDIPAGRTDLVPMRPGTTHRIMTGAPMPPGADSIVPVELTDGGTETAKFYEPVEVGRHLRRTGEDVTAGTEVLPAGTLLGPAQLGLAAAVGSAELTCYRRPHVLVLSTGSELVAAGSELKPGQIYESNGVMLQSAVADAGASAELLHFVPDDVEQFRSALKPYLATVDLLITSGGVSAGAYEVVKDALSGRGVEFGKVAMQPGGPQGHGRYEGVPVVTLPGNPVSAQISFEVFVRPALLAAMGRKDTDRPAVRARLTEGLTSPAGKRQYRRARYSPEDAAVTLVGGAASHLLAALASSNCLVRVPDEVESLEVGAEVTVLLLDRT